MLATTGALAPRRAVSIIGQVATALDAAHANGLVHRDIKPENILLTADDFAYLVDFGIAHGGGEAAVTSTGLVVGSSGYLAPERFGGERGGPAADVYALACVLYEALTGLEPFAAEDVRQMWAAHMFSAPPPAEHHATRGQPGLRRCDRPGHGQGSARAARHGRAAGPCRRPRRDAAPGPAPTLQFTAPPPPPAPPRRRARSPA